MTTPLLEVRHLRVEFPTRRGTLLALDDVSFDIAPGEILGVVGESGAGKSLTGAAIIGLLEPPGRVASGEIRLAGQRIDNLPAEAMRKIRGRRIGAIFQDPLTSLNPLYTVGRQLTETIQVHLGLSGEAARQRAVQLLQDTGIPAAEQRIDQYPHQFSGGMRQRVVIALALAAQPELIVADEPTTALDVSIQAQIIALLKKLTKGDRRPAAVLPACAAGNGAASGGAAPAGQGAAVHMPQSELTAQALADVLVGLSRETLLVMATKARGLARPHAAARVADEIEKLLSSMAREKTA